MQIGIFGGTFDPPHVGHLILADEACNQLELDKVLWVVTADPPHKKDLKVYPVDQRVSLVKAAIFGEEKFEFSSVDIDRPAPQYAVDTVRLIKKIYPGSRFIYLLGGDSLHDLPAWHDPQGFVKECDGIGVMNRLNESIDLGSLEKLLPGIKNKVKFMESPLLEISSHEIKQRIAEGKPYRYFLTQAVFELIEKKNFYHLQR